MLAVVIAAFLVALISLLPTKIVQMGTSPYFIFQVIPLPFWIAIVVIACTVFFMIPRLKENRFKVLFIFSSILLIICFRMAFPIEFTTIPAYEPDASTYMTVVNSWVTHGIDFGVQGNYQHNYPMAFLVAYAFVKLGVSLETFFRVAPFVIYALDMLFLYLILEEVMPEDKKKSAIPFVAIFLFSFSSLGYWVTVHYCPEILGSLMFFVSLYLGVRLAKAKSWSAENMLPVFAVIFILILSHHLSTLYLIITFFGLSLSTWFFKPQKWKNGARTFLVLGIFAAVAWFTYGEIVYPSFFNIESYLKGFSNVVQLSRTAGLIPNLTFAVYPVFIVILFAIEFLRVMQIQNPKSLSTSIKGKLREIRTRESGDTLFVFSMGFILIFVLFLVGLPVPVLFGNRIMEVLFIGMFPLASQTLIGLAGEKSWKKRALIIAILIAVVLVADYRYYSQIQRRVIFA